MKKIIRILGVVAFVMAMFFSVPKVSVDDTGNNSFDLVSMISLAQADAECSGCPGGTGICKVTTDCGIGTDIFGFEYTKTETECCSGEGTRSTCVARSCG